LWKENRQPHPRNEFGAGSLSLSFVRRGNLKPFSFARRRAGRR